MSGADSGQASGHLMPFFRIDGGLSHEYILSDPNFISVRVISSLAFWGTIAFVEIFVILASNIFFGTTIVFGFIPMYIIMWLYAGSRKNKIKNMAPQDLSKIQQIGYRAQLIPWNAFTHVRLKGNSLELSTEKSKYKLKIKNELVADVQTFFTGLGTSTMSKSGLEWTQLTPRITGTESITYGAPAKSRWRYVSIGAVIVVLALLALGILGAFVMAHPVVLISSGTQPPSVAPGYYYYVEAQVNSQATLTGSYTSTAPIVFAVMTPAQFQSLSVSPIINSLYELPYGTSGTISYSLPQGTFYLVWINTGTTDSQLTITQSIQLAR